MDERLLHVRSLLKEGRLEEAKREASRISDSYWRSYAMKWLAEALAERPKEAIEVALSIEEPSIKDETLRSLVYIFSREGRFKNAIETARKIKNPFLRKKALRTVGNFLAKVIAEKNTGIRLSDLNLDERDIEDIKPLPYGIVYKDGKLMPGSTVHRIKGEIREGIIELSGKTHERLEFRRPELIESETNEYVVLYVKKLVETGKLEKAEKLAKGIPEPIRSRILEEIGLNYIAQGKLIEAERILKELEISEVLGAMLAREYLDSPKKVLLYLKKTYDPVARLAVVYKFVKQNGTSEYFLREALKWGTDEWKLGRLIKFLAFEMLDEAKRKGDVRLVRISRELFELGKHIEKTFHTRRSLWCGGRDLNPGQRRGRPLS